MMCSVSQLCPGNPQSYIPVDSTEGVSVNDVVSCAQQIGRSCITPMETTTVIPTTSPTASPSSSPTSSPTPSPARTCVSDTTIRMNEFVVKPISIATSGSNFEIRGPIGDTFTGKIVYLSSLQSSTSFNGGLLSFTKAEQIETVSGTFDSNGLLQVTIANRFLTYFTVILCSDFQLTTEDEISVLFNAYPVSFSIADPSIFGTIYDVIGSIVGSNPGTNYAIILSGNTYTGTYFTDVASNNYNFYVVFRDSCTLELYAVSTTSNAGTSNIVVGADGNVHGLADFSPDPVDTTFGSINPKLVATT